ncbi:MAG: peptidase T [Coriobacteriia bacterium]|nr:peptidase T [Coriobacteriia bacterium]
MSPTDGSGTTLASELAPLAVAGFLRYVVIDTQADPESDSVPTTAKQLDLSRLLVEELAALGLSDAVLDEHGYVFATLPTTVAHHVPTIALIAHVDTAPDASGANVKPQVVKYEGGVMSLPGDSRVMLDPAISPELDNHIGHEIITSDGTTLLGADNKAGVAEIMAAVEYLVAHPEIRHGPVRICFTRDEEVGKGVDLLDLDRLAADAAYTIDGSALGSIEDETFSALEAKVIFTGIAVHPGFAKNRLVNAVKVACRFVESLPADSLSPETTDGREGFVNPMTIAGQEDRVTVAMNLRDFDAERLADHERLIRDLAADAVAAYPGSSVEIEVVEPYRNMKEYLVDHPHVVEAAAEAIRRTGLEVIGGFVRGGTDGSRLSQKGLPTPNLFTGQHDIHSLHEWICVDDMGAATETIVHLLAVWAENAERRDQ